MPFLARAVVETAVEEAETGPTPDAAGVASVTPVPGDPLCESLDTRRRRRQVAGEDRESVNGR